MMPFAMQIKGMRRNEDAMKYKSWYHKNRSNYLSSLVEKNLWYNHCSAFWLLH